MNKKINNKMKFRLILKTYPFGRDFHRFTKRIKSFRKTEREKEETGLNRESGDMDLTEKPQAF